MSLETSVWYEVGPEDLEALVPSTIMARGRDYYQQGQVTARLVAGDRLAAAVLGSAAWYNTTATLAGGALRTACTCPYQGPICKHAVAVILSWLTSPSSFLDLTRLMLLERGDPEALRRLCLELCLASPRVAAALLVAPEGRGEAEKPPAAWVHVRGLVNRPDLALRHPAALAERLSWITPSLFAAVAAGDPAAGSAGLELAGSLLAVWDAAPEPQAAALISRYLRDLAQAWPVLPSPILPAPPLNLEELPAPCLQAFAGELSLLYRAALSGSAPNPPPAPIPDLIELLGSGIRYEPARTVDFAGLLLGLDALERWGDYSAAMAMAEMGLRRPDEGERYLLRRRLAQYHEAADDKRQALAYLAANFRAYPEEQAWTALRRAALRAGEWPRVKREIWSLIGQAGRDLRIRAALDERDPELLRELILSGAYEARHEEADLWTAWAEFEPEEGFVRLLAAIREALAMGGHRSRRRAASLLRVLARLCRRQGWTERWTQAQKELRAEFGAISNWPELGALLGTE